MVAAMVVDMEADTDPEVTAVDTEPVDTESVMVVHQPLPSKLPIKPKQLETLNMLLLPKPPNKRPALWLLKQLTLPIRYNLKKRTIKLIRFN